MVCPVFGTGYFCSNRDRVSAKSLPGDAKPTSRIILIQFIAGFWLAILESLSAIGGVPSR